MIGVIGLGGAGGNIADEAQKVGFLSGAINFSQKDLDSVDVKHKLRLSGSEGVGKNRDEALRLFQEQWETAVNFIRDYFSNVNILVFAFSSSGGSGSSISPMLMEIITNVMPNKIVSAFVIMPDLSEAATSQMNCLNTFEDLSRLNISVFPIDNQQVKSQVIARNRIFEITNKKCVDLLFKVLSYTEKHSKNGNFDKMDFLTVLSTQGIAMMTEIDLASLNQNIELSCSWISKKVQESWSNSIFAPIEFEKVTRAAIIFDGQEGLLEFIDHQMMFGVFKNGIPLDLFEGNYHEHNGRLFVIMTGLAWCNKRLHDVELSLDDNKDKVESVLSVQSSYKSNTMDIFGKLRKAPEKKQTTMDILSKYTRKEINIK